DNQNVEKGKRQKEDSHNISSSTGASSNSEQAEILGTGITSTFKKQRDQNLSKNVRSLPKRLVPVRHYKEIQKVEEKVVQEKSIRTRSPRRRRATLLHFATINEFPNVARVQLLLSNISERPLQFRLKSEPGADISALPSAKGRIDAHSSAKCTLTWRREANIEKWSDAQQPKMLLILDFLHDKMTNEEHTLTRLIGKVVSGQTCSLDKPPIEQLMLDAAADESSRLTSKEIMVVEQSHSLRKETEMKSETKLDDIVNSIIDWLNQQSRNSLLGLLLLIIFFYFLGIISSSKRDEIDE
ncbi:unnamed protein product, partial [Onchocerca flexuosa]|uniref:MSP domain-containing protein n=1 Tax=Onchocerca flexuosa TaxID=387005 RepID=A0A183HFS9_9BILA